MADQITKEDREREPLRWCAYCDADCATSDPEHAATCPTNTGVYPVTERDVLCPGCGKTETGMYCVRCSAPFAVGDSYMQVIVDPGDPEAAAAASTFAEQAAAAWVSEVVCMSCAWANHEGEAVGDE